VQAKYPASAYRGVRAHVPDWLIGAPYGRYLERAVQMLELRAGGSAYDVACGSGYNLARLVRAVGSRGMVTAIEDNPHLLACARRKVERAGWQNVRLLASPDPAQIPHADGTIIGYNPPIVLQRPDLLEGAWVILRPGVVFPPWERAARHRPDGWPALWSGSGSSCSAIPAIGITGPCKSRGSTLRSFAEATRRSNPSWPSSTFSALERASTAPAGSAGPTRGRRRARRPR
jgi:SAM-dependent methyltransferase